MELNTDALVASSADLRAELSARREQATNFMNASADELFAAMLAEGRAICKSAQEESA